MAFADDVRIIDGVPQLAYSRVNGITAWTKAEQDDLSNAFARFSSSAPVSIIAISRTAFETALSTSGMKFKNYTEYQDCLNSKPLLQDKMDDLKASDQRKLKDSLDYLKSK